jgi:hypothetical protein
VLGISFVGLGHGGWRFAFVVLDLSSSGLQDLKSSSFLLTYITLHLLKIEQHIHTYLPAALSGFV